MRSQEPQELVSSWTTVTPTAVLVVIVGTVAFALFRLQEVLPPTQGFPAYSEAVPVLLRTVLFSVATAIGQTVLGIVAALCVLLGTRRLLGRLALVAAFILPYAIPSSVAALSVRFAVGPDSSIAGGLEALTGIPRDYLLIEHPLWIAAAVSIWQFFPFAFLLSYLALRGTPANYLRAARADGAQFFTILGQIVVRPALPVIAAIFFLRLAFMAVKFDIPYVFTEAIASNQDVASIEISRAIIGSYGEPLPTIAWGLVGIVFTTAIGYLIVRRVAREG